MKVTVEIITGTFIDTEVNENATVKELKENIATEVKLPVKRLILVVGDEEKRKMVMENEDEMMLRDLGVIEDCHMYLFFKHPDLVSEEERSQGGGDDDTPMEEILSEAESKRGNEENGHEEDDKAMKIEEKDVRDEKVEDEQEEYRDDKVEDKEEEKEKNEEEKDDDGGKEDGEKKVET